MARSRRPGELPAGFYLIDAKDLNEAIHLAAGIPPARYGSVKVRPVRELQVPTSNNVVVEAVAAVRQKA